MRRQIVFGAALVVLLLSATAASAVDVVKHLEYRAHGRDAMTGDMGKTLELEMDATVDVVWRRGEFLMDLADDLGVVPPGEPIAAEIDALNRLVKSVLGAHAAELRLQNESRRVLAEGGTFTGDSEWLAASDQHGKFVIAWTDTVAGWNKAWGDGRLHERANHLLEDLATNLEIAAGIQSFLELRLAEVADELARRIAEAKPIAVQMEARIQTSAFGTKPVHLDGYDNVQIGDATAFQRIQLAVDRRTMAELDAAKRLGSVYESVASGELQTEVTKAFEDLKAKLAELRDTVRSDVLEANLDQLVTDLKGAGDASLDPVIAEAEATRDWVRALSDFPPIEGEADIERLASLSRQIDTHVRTLQATVLGLPAALDNLASQVTDLADDFPDDIRTDLVAAIEAAIDDFKANHARLLEIYGEVKTLAEILGLSRDLGEAVAGVSQYPREIEEKVDLDTSFDLMTIAEVERHPGDRLRLDVRVYSNEGEKKQIVRETQTFQLQAYGLFVEPRGALLFVDPRSGIPRDLSFAPTVGVALHAKWGFKNAGWWNDWLRPGVGVCFTLLDFTDKHDVEVGIAGSVTFLKDLFWTGYGRNLQAKSEFFYLGVNPLAFKTAW